jgi:hypothetical protein
VLRKDHLSPSKRLRVRLRRRHIPIMATGMGPSIVHLDLGLGSSECCLPSSSSSWPSEPFASCFGVRAGDGVITIVSGDDLGKMVFHRCSRSGTNVRTVKALTQGLPQPLNGQVKTKGESLDVALMATSRFEEKMW